MTVLEKAMMKADEVFELVSGQFKKWDDKVEKTIKSLEDWRKGQVVSFSANKFTWSEESQEIFPSVLKAKGIESNRGGGYDPETGVFTAPSAGSYLFAATVFVSTLNGRNKDGSKPDFTTQTKWIEDIHFNLYRYPKDVNVEKGEGRDKIGEIWLGQSGNVGADRLLPHWYRNSSSTTAIHYLNAGEQIALEFVVWNGSDEGDSVMCSFNFSGTKLH